MPLRYLPLVMLLAACASAGGFSARGPYAPGIAPQGEDGVDGLIVGHRLMAAGEAELALKAYLLAASEHGANVDVLSALGSANLALGRLGQAETLLRRAVERDADFAPAWNNLGVVLMEQGETAEAARVFRTAVALDSGESDEIRGNLSRALAKLEVPDYPDADTANFALIRRGTGSYLILSRG